MDSASESALIRARAQALASTGRELPVSGKRSVPGQRTRREQSQEGSSSSVIAPHGTNSCPRPRSIGNSLRSEVTISSVAYRYLVGTGRLRHQLRFGALLLTRAQEAR